MKNKKKKVSKTLFKRKSIALAKEITRLKGYCIFCGAKPVLTEVKGKMKLVPQLHGSHIFPERGYSHMAANLDNIICLCSRCHKTAIHAWHSSPEIAVWWYLSNTAQFNRLLIQSNKPVDIDWQATYLDLKDKLRILKSTTN